MVVRERVDALMKATRSWRLQLARFLYGGCLFAASVVMNGPLPTLEEDRRGRRE